MYKNNSKKKYKRYKEALKEASTVESPTRKDTGACKNKKRPSKYVDLIY